MDDESQSKNELRLAMNEDDEDLMMKDDESSSHVTKDDESPSHVTKDDESPSHVTVTVGRLSSAEEDDSATARSQSNQQQQPVPGKQHDQHQHQHADPAAAAAAAPPMSLELHRDDDADEAKETTGLLKTSRSSSVLTIGGSSHQRPSLIKRSASSYLKRGSLPVAAGHELDVTDARKSLISRQVRSSYGTLYPPLYHKLSLLHRLSFAEIVDRITLTWENVNVYAPSTKRKMFWKSKSSTDADVQLQPKQILKNVNGAVEPGTLLAVMGASGSGKTTLLNVLTYRNRGSLVVQGEIRINGGRIGKGMASLSAYVQQEDLFIGTLTVSEHLWFQSQLKMDQDIPKEIRAERVDDVMQEMGLTKCASVLIGIPGKLKGISGGEKKRLAFASELLTNPPLMFLDEPTSGLDSYMAKNILTTLKTMTNRGRTVICTIHQPSSEVFELFDRLMLLSEGQVAYLGPASDATYFFKDCGFPTPANYNPADHFVRTLAVEPGKEEKCRTKIKTICERYGQSPQSAYIKKVIDDANLHEDGEIYDEESFADLSPYKASWFRQLGVLLWRSGLNNIREPTVFKVRLLQIGVLAIIFGLIYWHQQIDQTGLNNINGSLFLMQMQMTFGFIFNVVMLFPPEFPVFLREHFDGIYRVDTYFLSKTIVEFPQFILLPFLFTVIMYWCVGLYSSVESFLICFAVNLLVCNISVSFGYLLSTAFSDVGLALAVGPLFVVPCSMIGGFFVNTASIPIYFLWLKYLSWFTYANEILIVNQWQHIDNITCEASAGDAKRWKSTTLFSTTSAASSSAAAAVSVAASTTYDPSSHSDADRCLSSGMDIIEMFGYKPSNVPVDFLMLVVLMLGFRVISFVLLVLRARKSFKTDKK